MPVSPRVLTQRVESRLRQSAILSVYLGEVPTPAPIAQTTGLPDPSGRVAPYVVIWPAPGVPFVEEADLGDQHDDLVWEAHLTVVAGWELDCLAAYEAVNALLYRWTPSVAGVVCGRMRHPEGWKPGPVQAVTRPEPPRFWLPAVYQTTATIT